MPGGGAARVYSAQIGHIYVCLLLAGTMLAEAAQLYTCFYLTTGVLMYNKEAKMFGRSGDIEYKMCSVNFSCVCARGN